MNKLILLSIIVTLASSAFAYQVTQVYSMIPGIVSNQTVGFIDADRNENAENCAWLVINF